MGLIARPRAATEQAQSEHNQHDGQECLPYPSQHHKRSPEERQVRATPEARTTLEATKVGAHMPGPTRPAGIGSLSRAGIGSLTRVRGGLRCWPRSSTRSIEITAWPSFESALAIGPAGYCHQQRDRCQTNCKKS